MDLSYAIYTIENTCLCSLDVFWILNLIIVYILFLESYCCVYILYNRLFLRVPFFLFYQFQYFANEI